MRSDKEQLDIILQRKSTAEALRSKRRKYIGVACAFLVCVTAFAVFMLKPDILGVKKEEKAVETINPNGKYEGALDEDNVLMGDDNTENEPQKPVGDHAGDNILNDEEKQEVVGDKEHTDFSAGEELLSPPTSTQTPDLDDTDVDERFDSDQEQEDEGTGLAGDDNQCEPGDEAEVPESPDGESFSDVFAIDSDSVRDAFINELEIIENNVAYLPGRENMGIAMAWMLHIGGDDRLYNTVLQLSEEQLVEFSDDQALGGRYIEENLYFCLLSYDQVIGYASEGYKCLFVGRGLGNDEEISTRDKAGIECFCQLYGDLFVFEKAVMY